MTEARLTEYVAWIASLGGAGGIGAVLYRAYARSLDHRRDKRRQTDEVALNLVRQLKSRVEQLESDRDEERDRCDRKLEKAAAELRVMSHRCDNQRTIIYSLVHLFDVPAARRKAMLDSIKADLRAMEQAEATEIGLVIAAPISPPAPAE